jgi:four helix bundle protein
MHLDEWVDNAPRSLREGPAWRVRAYQVGTFAAVCAADDAIALGRYPRFAQVAPQLVRAAGSIAANIAEGYPRRSRKDRIRYYEYALGSAREAATWYVVVSAALERTTLEARLSYLTRVSQLLVKMINNERAASSPGFSPPTA